MRAENKISRRRFLLALTGTAVAASGAGALVDSLLNSNQTPQPDINPTPEPDPTVEPTLTFSVQKAERPLVITLSSAPTVNTTSVIETSVAGTRSVQEAIEQNVQASQQAELSTPTLTPSETLLPTETPVITTPTPSATFTITPTPDILFPITTVTPVPPQWISAYLSTNNEWLAISQNGLARLDIDAYREYFQRAVANDGLDENGLRDDFNANMLGTGTNGELTLSHSLNFWINEKRGLGWTGNEPIYGGLDEMRGDGWENLFQKGDDGIYRFEVRLEAKDFDKAIAYASVVRYLIGAEMVGMDTEQINSFLSEQDPEIRNLFWTLVGTTGYEPVASDRPNDEPVISWPGAQSIKEQDYNLVSNAGDVCVTYLVSAQIRDGQREVAPRVTYRMQREEQTPQNDEDQVHSDSEGDIILSFTFDPNSTATVGGALSPNNQGTMRVDVIRESDIQDLLQPWDYIPAPDNATGVLVRRDTGRWVPCGTGIPATETPIPAEAPAAPEVFATPAGSPPQVGETDTPDNTAVVQTTPSPAGTNIVNPPTATQGRPPTLEATASDVP